MTSFDKVTGKFEIRYDDGDVDDNNTGLDIRSLDVINSLPDSLW